MFGFDAGIIGYDPAETLMAIDVPGLLIYAENDKLVSPDLNLQRLDEIYAGNPPAHLATATIAGANHQFRVVENTCLSYDDSLQRPQSEELIRVLNNWLAEQGY